MGHPRRVVRTVFPKGDGEGFFTPSGANVAHPTAVSSRLVNSDHPLRGNEEINEALARAYSHLFQIPTTGCVLSLPTDHEAVQIC
jgi:hypothetical protein